MKELISVAVLVASLYGGSLAGSHILHTVRKAALSKAAVGLPRLSTLSRSLTAQPPADDQRKVHRREPTRTNEPQSRLSRALKVRTS
jgi:hypothetical protein